jgi:biotin operon repressor
VDHVVAAIDDAPTLSEPFTHCVVDEVFPAEFYEDLLDYWPDPEVFLEIAATGRVKPGAYPERGVIDLAASSIPISEEGVRKFWIGVYESGFRSGAVIDAALRKFRAEIGHRSNELRGRGVTVDTLLVSDRTNYRIGPHTDNPAKLLTLLFYLADDSAFGRFGTSLYVPLDAQFRCRGGPHYDFASFRRAKVVEYLPNRLLLFPKSDRCFHGVEALDLVGFERKLIICDLRLGKEVAASAG